MKSLPKQYNHKETEKRWQDHWLATGTYHWDESAPRAQSYVIDTPPPTVSGLLHMGHVFSYTQADFVARWQRMNGKTVFYPMGFDDNGLPTERLVEKVTKKRAVDYPSREAFIEACEGIAEEARGDFRTLFQSIALSVDWRQEYHTISAESRKIAQLSFLDLYRKGHVERRLEPMLWDPVDQTAIAQAEVEDKELPSHFCDIKFRVIESDRSPLEGEQTKQDRQVEAESGGVNKTILPPTGSPSPEGLGSPTPPQGGSDTITIATTRPELIPACVAVFYHPDDARYRHLKGKHAVTPLFGVKVPILEDDTVEMEKGTGIMMCCTFGDEKDIEKWRKHKLPLRLVLNKYGKMDFSSCHAELVSASIDKLGTNGEIYPGLRRDDTMESLANLKAAAARAKIIELLTDSGDLIEAKPITHAVKCAERSGAPLEILPSPQWFVKVTDKKAALKARSAECNWHPEWMAKRMEQWIDGLSWDWCVSRQRYYGVPFPVWYVSKKIGERPTQVTHRSASGEIKGVHESTIADFQEAGAFIASPEDLPINPLSSPPPGIEIIKEYCPGRWLGKLPETGEEILIAGDADVMDTWFTSSVSPQLNSKGITARHPASGNAAAQDLDSAQSLRDSQNDESYTIDPERHAKLFPADLRPQAHEIIRTWAFYTLVKAHLHADTIPWKNLMISGWCLAEDKQKMSKSKGNVVTPIDLIEENGADVVRYWASTSKLGQDTAFSRDLLKIGKKLVNKLWNATQFAAIHLEKLDDDTKENGKGTERAKGLEGLEHANSPAALQPLSPSSHITATLDRWILTRLHRTVAKATEDFAAYEYASALRAIEDFFWNDFCDNYLELVKKRVYSGEIHSPLAGESNSAQQNLVGGPITNYQSPFTPSPPTESLRSSAPPQGGSDKDAQLSAVHTIALCLDGILRLFAPILPHVTEELWSHIFEEKYAAIGSIHARGNWPQAGDYPLDEAAEAEGIAVVALLEAIRKAKSEKGVSIKWPILAATLTPLPQGEGNVASSAPAEVSTVGEGFLSPSAQADLCGAGNIETLSYSATPPQDALTTESGEYALSLTFAAESDAA